MFVPLRDVNNPVYRVRWPFVTHAIILINVLIWAYLAGATDQEAYGVIINYAFKPQGVPEGLSGLPLTGWDGPDIMEAFLSSFLHRDVLHLLGNMLCLWVFADNVEDAMGHWRFVIFYALCAIGAAYAQGYATPGYFTYGASGAVSGIMIAYVMLHPHVRLWVLVLVRIPLRIPAVWVIGAWVLFQVYNIAVVDIDESVGWYAHLGGVLVGAALLPIMKRPDVALFDRGPIRTKAKLRQDRREPSDRA